MSIYEFMFKNILEFTKAFSTEAKCEKFLISKRWTDGKVKCVYCKHDKVCKTGKGKEQRYKCSQCNNKFTLKVGTIFEGSKIGLKKWFVAIYIISLHKKGISSCQLAKDLDITQKSAWFLKKKIKMAMSTQSFEKLMYRF